MRKLIALLSLVAISCDNDKQVRPPASPVCYTEMVQKTIDGEEVLIEIEMKAVEKYRELDRGYLWYITANYDLPEPFELRAVNGGVPHYFWDNDFLPEKYHKNKGQQRYATHNGLPHRGTGKFWLSNKETGTKIEVELPIWGYFNEETPRPMPFIP
jgi:hypothetical protein